MQIYAYTDAVIDKLNAYARSISPSPRVSYALLHPEVHVLHGCLPIQVTQFSRSDPAAGHHWAIFIPTSPVPWIGHYYELAGDSPPYRIKSTIDDHNARRGQERGSYTVGYVLPLLLPYLEAHFALVPVENRKRLWNCQNWVCDALQGLDHPLMFAIGMTLEDLTIQMAIVSNAWETGNRLNCQRGSVSHCG